MKSKSADAPGHTHMLTLTPANLVTLRGGGTVEVLATNNDSPVAHTHRYRVSCH